jgi:hypothetical protein
VSIGDGAETAHGGMPTAMADMLRVVGANLQTNQQRFLSSVHL